jgi:hypothetical protein
MINNVHGRFDSCFIIEELYNLEVLAVASTSVDIPMQRNYS